MIVQLANFATTFSLPSQPTDLVAIGSMQLRQNSRQLHCLVTKRIRYILHQFDSRLRRNLQLASEPKLWLDSSKDVVVKCHLQLATAIPKKKMNIIEGSLEVRLPTYLKMERTDREKVRRQREDKRWTRSKREKSDERV